jgi:hypothetical protein
VHATHPRRRMMYCNRLSHPGHKSALLLRFAWAVWDIGDVSCSPLHFEPNMHGPAHLQP